jgi:integrase
VGDISDRDQALHLVCLRYTRAVQTNINLPTISATGGARLIQNGMSLYEVSNILGHVDVETTQRYAHLENVDVGRKARDIMETING